MPQAHDAFISYSHAVDSRLAPALEHGLERLARPWNRLRAMSVFRDESELGAADHLWGRITSHLDGSRFFILLACPEAAASRWVNREVSHWCDTRGTETMLLIWTGGTLAWDDEMQDFTNDSTAIPDALRGRFVGVPLYIDLVWARDASELGLRHTEFRAAVLHVASPIHGKPPEELEGEDIRLHRRARRLARSAVAALVALTIVTGAAAVVAVSNAQRADRRTREAVARQVGLASIDIPAGRLDQAFLMSLASGNLAGDGPERFQPTRVLTGRYSRLRSILHVGTTDDGSGRYTNVQGLAFSPDAATVYATVAGEAASKAIATWDAGASSARLEPLPSATGGRLDVSADGTRVIVGADGAPALRDGAGTGEFATIAGSVVDLDRWSGVAWLSAQPGASPGTLSLMSAIGSEPLLTIDADPSALADVGRSRAVALVDGELRTVDLTTGAVEATATAVPPARVIAAGSADEAAVVVATTDNRVLRWARRDDELTVAETVALPSDVGIPRWLAVAPDGQRVVVVGSAGTALVEFGSGRVQLAEGGGATVAEADPSGRFVALGGSRLAVWDLQSGQRVVATPQVANAVAWSGPCDAQPRCRLVAAGVSLDVIDPIAETQIRLVDELGAQAVAISRDGSRIASGGWGTTVAVWSVEPIVDDSTRERLPDLGDPAVASAGPTIDARCDSDTGEDLRAVSPQGNFVVGFTMSDGVLAVCATAAPGPPISVGRLDLDPTTVRSVAVDDDGNVVVGRAPGIVDYYARSKGTFRRGNGIDVRVGGEEVNVSTVAIRGGVVVAGTRFPQTSSTKARVLIWRLTEQEPTTFTIDYVDVAAVAVLDEQAGAIIVAGRDSSDGPVTLQLWETISRRRVGRAFTGLEGTVVELVGAGTAVEGTDESGRSFRWQIDQDPAREVCQMVGRSLTIDEWRSLADGALARYRFDPPCA